MTRRDVLWGVSMWELTLMYWADYERTAGKLVRWQPDIRDRIKAILEGATDGDT